MVGFGKLHSIPGDAWKSLCLTAFIYCLGNLIWRWQVLWSVQLGMVSPQICV